MNPCTNEHSLFRDTSASGLLDAGPTRAALVCSVFCLPAIGREMRSLLRRLRSGGLRFVGTFPAEAVGGDGSPNQSRAGTPG